MISVVIYGRNDSYGYNLHKRAAISLNCIAEILDDPDDEILFVDYNSSDDGPTFPEAIADTLTATTKRRLRILRARAAVHERFRTRTRLDAIEPIARNVAVRRSNPANRWILSTNSDIILVPRRTSSLSEVAAALPHGFYHTARFELPESLWETFDRAAPRQTIEEVRGLGVSARLNEVVRSDLILFDGPGDFQLVERADLFAIDGFDEEMILGWHVDANLAARLALKHRQVSPLLDEVFCYHCDHTRRATLAHSGERIENDWHRFVRDITRPDLPEQRDRWGCIDDKIEEIRLDLNALHGYRAVLEAAVPPLDGPFTEIALSRDTFDSYEYEPAHVLPFLADLLHNYPRDAALGWCGVRADMFALFNRVWGLLGFSQPIAVEAASAARGIAATAAEVRIASRADWAKNCDLLVFEFGRAAAPAASGDVLEPDDVAALQSVRAAFLDTVAAERARLAEDLPPRRLIGINCINNRMEPLFAAHVGVTRTPFSSHLRHGFLLRPPKATSADSELLTLLVGQALGRDGPISRRELALARYLFGPLPETGEIASGARPLLAANAALGRAYLEVAGRSPGGGSKPAATLRAIAALEAVRAAPSEALGLVIDDTRIAAERRPLSRFAAYEDWDDPAWAQFLDKAERIGDGLQRDSAVWERTHYLYGLDRLWKLVPSARVLVVVTMPDPLIARLAERVGQIDLLEIGGAAGAETPEQAWRRLSTVSPAIGDGRRRYQIADADAGFAGLPPQAYDAILFPHGSLFKQGPAIHLLEAAAPLLKPDGVLVFKAEIAAGTAPHPELFDARVVAPDGLAARLAAATEFVADGGFDRRLSRTTLDKVCPETGPAPETGYFVTRRAGRIVIPSLWFLRRARAAPAGEWGRVHRWLAQRHCGEQIGKLRIGPAGERQGSDIVCLPGWYGYIFSGPYLPVPCGDYHVQFAIELSQAAGPGEALTLDVFDGSEVLAKADIDAASLSSGVVELAFEVPPGEAGAARAVTLELRAIAWSDVDLRFTSVELQPAEAEFEAPATDPVEAAIEEAPAGDAEVADAAEAEDEPLEANGGTAEALDSGAAASCLAHADAPMDRNAWERAKLLHGLAQAGALRPAARVAVAATHPDAVIAELSERIGSVDVVDLRGAAHRAGAAGRLYWTDGRLYARDRLRILDAAGLAGLAGQDYDAIVFPHGSLLAAGVAGVAGLLETAEAALAPAGLVAFTVDMAAGEEAHPDFLDEGVTGEDGLAARLAETTGLRVESGLDAATPAPPHLARQQEGRLLQPRLWFLRKDGAAPEGGWDALAAWLGSRLMGDQMQHLLVGKAGRRQGPTAIESVRGSKGHVFYGPYLALPAGAYKATIGFEPHWPRGANFAFEIVAGEQKLAQRRMSVEDIGSRQDVSLLFDVPPAPDPVKPPKVEIRAWSGGAEAVFFECRLDCLGRAR